MTRDGDAPAFSIITFCMGRLDHLKQSLPRMVDQSGGEVIVVDFSCPQGAADFVEENFPQVKTVRVPNRSTFAICEARNAGAAVASGNWLAFVDADTILQPNALSSVVNNLKSNCFARFAAGRDLKVHKSVTSPLSLNSLRGFMMIERRNFEMLGGYDEVLQGYGAGGDVEFEYRLRFFRFNQVILPESIVDRVIHHDDELRLNNMGLSFVDSYIRGRVYFQIKRTVMGFFGRSPPPAIQKNIYQSATELSKSVLESKSHGSTDFGFHQVKVKIDDTVPAMNFRLSIHITVDLDEN